MPTDDLDPGGKVSAGYREIATEQTPDALDRAILARSRRISAVSGTRSWRESWYRPAIFLGLLGLTLSLLLEYSSIDTGQPTGVGGRDSLDSALSEAQALADGAASQTDAAMRQTAIETAIDETVGEPGDGSLLDEKEECTAEERATPSRWWECIEELGRLGRMDAAESELQALMQAHPDFTAPRASGERLQNR